MHFCFWEGGKTDLPGQITALDLRLFMVTLGEGLLVGLLWYDVNRQLVKVKVSWNSYTLEKCLSL